MADYQVNPVAAKGIVEEMTAAGAQLLQEINELKAVRTELSKRWEGQANLAYDEILSEDIRLLDAYYTLLVEYENVLLENTMDYAATEDENVQKLLAPAE